MKNLDDIFNYNNPNFNNFHLEVAIESLIDGNPKPAYEHLTDLLFDEISEIQSNYKTINLYRFVKLKTLYPNTEQETKPIIEDIKKNALTFGNPNSFNDPMDPILKEWLNLKEKTKQEKVYKKLFKQLKKTLGNLRICCLSQSEKNNTQPFLNPLMWAHYADSHRGICIQYEITKESLAIHNNDNQILRMVDVRYRNKKAMSDYITIDNALLAKGECWEYEHEKRLIYFKKNTIDQAKNYDDYIQLEGFNIKAIYLGYRISESDKRDVIEAVKGKKINLYNIEFDNNDITTLVKVSH